MWIIHKTEVSLTVLFFIQHGGKNNFVALAPLEFVHGILDEMLWQMRLRKSNLRSVRSNESSAVGIVPITLAIPLQHFEH